jgi:hypothetical protein
MSGRLAPEDVEAIARRVVELLVGSENRPAALIDAAEVARRAGMSRAYVYEHASQLGAIRLGSGPRARLRFDPATAEAAIRTLTRSAPPAPRAVAPARRHRPSTTRAGAALLPVSGRAP